MELLDTIEMMKSDDYKERFKAEYYQLKIRLDKLNAFISKGICPESVPEASHLMLKQQAIIMEAYLKSLDERARLENIKV